ncbi:MAG: tol-pal system protein YbgF [Gammaproteobacteria bacterium]|nr:tol-pal system protein YbgF [Gammaproteobacteria bacterium]
MTQYFRTSLIKYVSVALVVLAAPSFVSDAMARKPAPVIEASGEPVASAPTAGSLEQRLQRLERLLENQTLIDLMTRIDSLQNEVQQMLGQMEEQTYSMEQLQKRQRDLYLDVDRRLRDLEAARASLSAAPIAPASGVPSGAMSEPTANGAAVSHTDVASQEERAAYERAFNLLKEGRYDLAVSAFKTFVQTYPQGPFVDNAQYWLGEANYVQRNFAVALGEFDKVVKNHPNSPKRADALLKMGYTFQELGQNDNARMSLNKVIKNYPNTTAARLAQKRLQDLKQL